ncbi:MAG: iron-containing alcohol dehydrogenase [Oscillospiraceae bacterium]
MERFGFMPVGTSIGENAYDDIGRICAPYGKSAVIIGGIRSLKAASDKMIRQCAKAGIKITAVIWYGGECTEESVSVLCGMQKVNEADMIFSAGGGRCTDCCKCTADRLNKPLFCFPTCASCFAAYSDIAFIGGEKKKTLLKNAARHVFLDADILSKADPKYFMQAVCYAFLLRFEAEVSSRYNENDDMAAFASRSANALADLLYKNAAKAYSDNKNSSCGKEFTDAVFEAMAAFGSISVITSKNEPKEAAAVPRLFVKSAKKLFPDGCPDETQLLCTGLLAGLIADGQIDEYFRLKRLFDITECAACLRDLKLELSEDERLAEEIFSLSDGEFSIIDRKKILNAVRMLDRR